MGSSVHNVSDEGFWKEEEDFWARHAAWAMDHGLSTQAEIALGGVIEAQENQEFARIAATNLEAALSYHEHRQAIAKLEAFRG